MNDHNEIIDKVTVTGETHGDKAYMERILKEELEKYLRANPEKVSEMAAMLAAKGEK